MPTANQFSVAIHLMVALADAGARGLSSRRLAESMNVSSSFLRRTLLRLGKLGLVHSERGKNGAYKLAKSAEMISLLEIYKAIELPSSRVSLMKVSYPIKPAVGPALEYICRMARRAWESELGNIDLARFRRSIY